METALALAEGKSGRGWGICNVVYELFRDMEGLNPPGIEGIGGAGIGRSGWY